MPKRRQSRSRRHKRSHGVKRGGSGNYTSASTYGSYVNGTGDQQFARTFDQSGPYGARMGTEYVGAQGQWANQPNMPSSQNLSLIQSAGSRRKRGGLFGEVLSQAIVPAAILGMQQTYRKRTGGRRTQSRRTRRARR
jgi:hypothetical protein